MGAAALGREANTRQRVRRREAGPVAGVGPGRSPEWGPGCAPEREVRSVAPRSSSLPLLAAGGGTAEAARRRRHWRRGR